MNNHQLNHLMRAYFNQDYYLSGETIEEVMQTYLDCETPDTIQELIINCEDFAKSADAENMFNDLYRYDFKPARWGLTSVGFLQIVSDQAKIFLRKENVK